MKTKRVILPFVTFIAFGLTACNIHKTTIIPESEAYSDTSETSLEEHCIDLQAKEWIRVFVLPSSLRKEALSTVEKPNNNQQAWLRAMLLTHNEASYRELREAENLHLKQLKLSDARLAKCESEELLDYILKLNRTFQKQKSEVVLLQRQLNEQTKIIEMQTDENVDLQKKIEALTNIEHRMKLRSKKVNSEASK